MTPKEFQRECKAGQLSGSYFFTGEEEYLKNRCLLMARNAFFGDGGDDSFGHVRLSGEDADFLETLAEEMNSFSMFTPRKLIEVHSVDYDKLSKGNTEELLFLLDDQKENENCVLILYAESDEFDAGQLPKRPSALYKSLEKCTRIVLFDYETPASLNSWVCRHFAAANVVCSPETAAKIIGYCSKDMYSLSSETEKLICYTLANGQNTVDPGDIETVCCGKSIDGAFDFTNALMRADASASTRLLCRMKERREKPENILGGVIDTLTGMYSVKVLRDEGKTQEEIAAKLTMNPYRVKNFDLASKNKKAARLEGALKLCMDADLKIKSSPIDDYALLDRLVVRLCRV